MSDNNADFNGTGQVNNPTSDNAAQADYNQPYIPQQNDAQMNHPESQPETPAYDRTPPHTLSPLSRPSLPFRRTIRTLPHTASMASPHSRPRPLSRHTVSRATSGPGIRYGSRYTQPLSRPRPLLRYMIRTPHRTTSTVEYGRPSQPAQSAQPSYGQPAAPAYDPNNAYAQPDYNQANYGQQGYAAPSYNQSAYTQPAYAQQPVYGQPVAPAGYAQKSKLAAGLLGIFLGCFGVHNFYLGNTGKAVAQLLLTVIGWILIIGPAVAGIWGLVEGILILCSHYGSQWHRDAQGVELQD